MKILVSGASGQLARAIGKFWTGGNVLLPTESELNLANRDSIRSVIQNCRPEVFLNCAAYTNVDVAESDADQSLLVNGTAVQWIAHECDEVSALLVQISTDYVFDGRSSTPRHESDAVNPCNVYGKSKLLGEEAASASKDYLIFRTAWLYDAWGKNFFTTMLKLAEEGRPLRIVNDQFGSPTSCRALARQIQFAVENNWRGLFHATCSGEASWFDFAEAIFKHLNPPPNFSPCPTHEYPTVATRPAYSVLDNSRRLSRGTDLMGTWQDALSEVIADKALG